MNISVICIGKLKEKYWTQAVEEYSKRLKSYCSLDIIELKEARLFDKAGISGEQAVKDAEGEEILKKLKDSMYVITLSAGSQNHLEFYSGLLLRQRVFDLNGLFVVGLADGYGECLAITEKITDEVYSATGGADIRNYILERQQEYEKAGQ